MKIVAACTVHTHFSTVVATPCRTIVFVGVDEVGWVQCYAVRTCVPLSCRRVFLNQASQVDAPSVCVHVQSQDRAGGGDEGGGRVDFNPPT